MFLIQGTRRYHSRLGFRVDYCPICRELTRFEGIRAEWRTHFFFLPYGSPIRADLRMRCLACGASRETSENVHLVFTRSKGMGLEEMLRKTLPNAREVYGPQLLNERNVRFKSRYGLEERMAILMEPLAYLEPEVRRIFTSGQSFDRRSGKGCLLTFAAPLLLFHLLRLWAEGQGPLTFRQKDHLGIAVLAVFAVLLAYTLWAMLTQSQRQMRFEIAPRLAKSLALLHADQQEVVLSLQEAKHRGLLIGSKLNPDQVWTLIQTLRVPPED